MTVFKVSIIRFPIGIWIALTAILLAFLGWMMQAYSLINWENAVQLGLQDNSFNGSSIEKMKATKEKGEAIADLLWALPIAIIAFIGLIRKRFYGFVAAMMEFAICVYFPLFYVFQLWDSNRMTAIAAVILWGIPSFLGIIGLWMNRKFFQ